MILSFVLELRDLAVEHQPRRSQPKTRIQSSPLPDFLARQTRVACLRSSHGLVEGNPNLVPCPDCGHSVSIRATFCPNCGAMFANRKRLPLWVIWRKQLPLWVFWLVVCIGGAILLLMALPAWLEVRRGCAIYQYRKEKQRIAVNERHLALASGTPE